MSKLNVLFIFLFQLEKYFLRMKNPKMKVNKYSNFASLSERGR